MRTRILATATLAAAFLSGLAFAQTPKAEEDHSAHHPAGSAPTTSVPASGAAPSPEALNQQMKAMQEMRQKMQAAKTPAERARLMDEHMKLMQSGMAMMGQMHGGNVGMAGMPAMGGAASGGMGMMHQGTPGAGGQPPAGNSSGMGSMMNMHTQMERRMAMMEQMMQMMVDREAAMPGK